MQVSALHVYPVKSLRGSPVARADVERAGLRGDRRWMVVDEAGSVLSARHLPAMLAVTARTGPTGALELTTAGRGGLHVDPPRGGPVVEVQLSRLATAVGAGEPADGWLSDVLGRPARLVWLDDPNRRSVSAGHGGRPGDMLSLADTGPLLLTSTASLRRLDRWVAAAYSERYAQCGAAAGSRPAPLDMERFRPNVVVDGDVEPFVEDTWQTVRIGTTDFRVSELCDRCALVTLDPQTQVRGQEPLRTLAKHRRWDGLTWFGVRLVPEGTGSLRIGDRVQPGPGTVRT